MSQHLIAALYKFVELPDYRALQAPVRAFCEAHDIKGTLLLAAEGINGTIAGAPANVKALLAYLRRDPRLSSMTHKESWSNKPPFVRLKVRLKNEIVALGVPGVNPSRMAGTYVKPEDWNALISREDVVVIDTRNTYEVQIGTFKHALNPQLASFSDLPDWLAQQQSSGGCLETKDSKKPKVAMFCTGGIRCEKSTAYLRMQGFDEVYHLEGGILKYLESVPAPGSLWQGQCFVFDERVSVGHGLEPGHYVLCRACGEPLSEEDCKLPSFVKGVSCRHCVDKTSPTKKRGFSERQRQVMLAREKGDLHVGATRTRQRPTSKKKK